MSTPASTPAAEAAPVLPKSSSRGRLAFGTRPKRLARTLTRKLNGLVMAVLAVGGFVYVVARAAARDRWADDPSELATHELVLAANTALGLAMYLCCVFRDPGKVPSGWSPFADAEEARANQHSLVECKRDGGARFCKKCREYKPPRTHHCSQCKRCVLRMDHHCAWVNNCIGHRNYKSFLLFLVYVVAALIHATGILLLRGAERLFPPESPGAALSGSGGVAGVATEQKTVEERSSLLLGGVDTAAVAAERVVPDPAAAAAAAETSEGPSALLELAAALVAAPLTVALCLLFGWHVYLVVNNKTTIEHFEGVRSKMTRRETLERRGRDGVAGALAIPREDSSTDAAARMATLGPTHPYSLGVRGNLREILGRRALCWLWPGCKVNGDGLAFANINDFATWKSVKTQREAELALLYGSWKTTREK